MSRAEITAALSGMFWGDRLLFESARDDLDRCGKFRGEVEAKIRKLRDHAPPGDVAIDTAITRINRCLGCLEPSWDYCWDVPESLRELGASTPSMQKRDRAPVTGEARKKERADIIRGVESYLKKVVKMCKSTPGTTKQVSDPAYELELRARALEPVDDNVLFATSLLSSAAECDPNTENYVRVVRDTALPRAKAEPDGRVIRD